VWRIKFNLNSHYLIDEIEWPMLKEYARPLNVKPFKKWGWKSPMQALAREIEQFQQRVALDS